ncbi:MAG: amidohydrolase family protein [Chloroflexi bacterium]|nr:amidohydrolase family protein [Chloroflexota bacterium]
MSSSILWGKYLVARAYDDRSDILSDGALYQEDGTIVDVGPYSELKARYAADEVIGGEQFVVIPGLVNAHHHGRGLTSFQMGSHDDPLEYWITEGWGRRGVDLRLNTLYSCTKLIRSGVTTVMYNHPTGLAARLKEECEIALKAFREAGQRVAFSPYVRSQYRVVYEEDDRFLSRLPRDLAARVKGFLDGGYIPEREYLTLFETLHREHAKDPDHKVNLLLSPANAHWCSDETLRELKRYAARFKTGIHMHLVESIYQKLIGLRLYGKTPVQHLNDLGFLGPEVSFAHGVWVNGEDMKLMAQNGVSFCHNPTSNLRLKSGIAPVAFLMQEGVNVALGSDSSAINEDEDMLQEMRLAHKLHRPPGVNSPSLTADQVMKMATVNGATATLFHDVGALEKGKRADAVLVRLQNLLEPYLDPSMSIVDALVYRARALDVDTVVINGHTVLKDGRFTHLDEQGIIQELKRALSRPLTQAERERLTLVQELMPYVRRFYESWDLGELAPFYYYNSQR